MNELINKDNEWIIHFMGSLDRLLDNVEHLTANYRPTLNGERFFTDKEVSARLKVSRRTLQDYRNEGRIAYIQLGGKILYRESDIERMLADNFRAEYAQTRLRKILPETALPPDLANAVRAMRYLCIRASGTGG